MNKQMRIKWINQEYEKVVEKNRGVPPDRNIDFVFWGSVESGDERYLYLKSIKETKKINSYYIGVFKGDGFTANMEGWFPMREILPILFRSRMSICFNWYDEDTNITTRLYECMGAGVVPLLVGNDDINNFGKRWEAAKEEVGIELAEQSEQYIRVNNPQEAITTILEYTELCGLEEMIEIMNAGWWV